VRFRAVLFDVDGTLVHAGGAGRRSIERALEHHLGPRIGPQETWLGELKLDGMTDRLIVRYAMESVGVPFAEDACDAILASYAEALTTEIHGPGYEVLPGVEALLGRLHAEGRLVGLCTGNIARGARIKLGRGGLHRWFGWDAGAPNGFAEDGEARHRIVAAVLRRAAARLGALAPHEAVVVGDTPRDVESALACGVPVLAVTTGRFGAAELRASGADAVVATLADPAALEFLLG
jgi:phosphoglycolate phosphatase-like HAD superfamily hydrolase